MQHKQYTIKDIAKLAGVSNGTVDRVLHKRGKVSDKAKTMVNNVLRKIEYRPNPIARNLKNNKLYKICILIPDAQYDSYWIPAYEGIEEATKEFGVFGVTIELHKYHPKKKYTFIEKSREVIEISPDALLMPPIFKKESLSVLKQCKDKNIKIAFFNNYIKISDQETFIGQDLEQTGRVAANLLDKIAGANARIGIVHIDMEYHMKLKENGFKAYFKDKSINSSFLKIKVLKTDSTVNFEKELALFLTENTKLSALFVTNSKAYKLIEALEKNKHQCIVVGYDLLKENIDYLKKGKIDFLVHQNPKRQAYLAIAQFAEFFLFCKTVSTQKLLPIDIITLENVESHLL